MHALTQIISQQATDPCKNKHQAKHKDASILLCGEQPVVAAIVQPKAAERAELESFVRQMFYKVHKADITHFMPKLLSLRDSNQQLRAVCGLRHAHEERLFLEHYFDAPIEQILSDKTATKVSRDEILEIGNLAILEPACIRSLLASISVYLHSTDAKWAVFTGITTLRNALNKLNMPLHMLGEAKIICLPTNERVTWGTYYEERPQIMAICRMQHGTILD
ncbi:MAG: thermostable hemolysin [Methylophilaceae bacterium]